MESIKVNLIPNGTPEACHVSQYDTGRVIRLLLFEGLTPYTIKSGDTFTLNIRKPDNHIITESVSGTQGNNYLDITTTAQYCAAVGENLCEIRVANNGANIGSLNFIMKVERDVIADGIASESVIEDLSELIAEAIGDDYYNKNETDALLDTKADKTELLDVYPVLATTPAPIANFSTDRVLPLKSCTVEIKPKQAASANPPSPSNPLPISGTDTVIITQTGKNLFDKSTATIGKYINPNNQEITDANKTHSAIIKVKPTATYYMSGYGGTNIYSVLGLDANKNPISNFYGGASKNEAFVCTLTSAIHYVILNFNTDQLDTVIFAESATATAYEAYSAITKTVSLPSTVIGGEVDLIGGSGEIDTDIYTFTGSENWIFNDANQYWYFSVASVARPKTSGESTITENGIIAKMYDGGSRGLPRIYLSDNPSITSLTDMTTIFASGQKIAFKTLETTPITLANPIDLTAKAGVNNVFGDTDGNTSVEFRESVQKYVDDNIAAITPSNTPNLLSLNRTAINLEEVNSPETDDTDNETREER